MKFLVIVFFSVPCVLRSYQPSASNKHIEGRIVGGELARASQFSYSAAIYSTTPDNTYFCGGALISNQWILTNAQCIAFATQFTISLGSNNLEGPDPNRLTLVTATYVTHPGYNPETLENDVGLIRLRLPINFNEFISAIALPQIPLGSYATVTALGWGHDSDDNAGLLINLHFVQLTTISNAECSLLYGGQIADGMVCTMGEFNQGICTGDSGGPLVEYRTERAPVHVAIATFVSGDGCESPYPSGYTRTYPYVDWIREITGITG